MTFGACVHRARRVLLLCALGGCFADETWDQSNIDTMTTHDGFARIDAHAYASALGPPGIDVFVNPESAAAYRLVDPGKTGSNAVVPRGTMIVRAVLDGGGAITKLTMMCKGPEGYDPSLGDWWFAETDAVGTPIVDNGVPLIGRLEACHQCHTDRAADGYLFGVPAADR